MQKFTVIIFMLITSTVFAGPNWEAIENARNQKEEVKAVELQQKTKHEIALQKLQEACDKVKDHAELADACQAIMEADAELNAAK